MSHLLPNLLIQPNFFLLPIDGEVGHHLPKIDFDTYNTDSPLSIVKKGIRTLQEVRRTGSKSYKDSKVSYSKLISMKIDES